MTQVTILPVLYKVAILAIHHTECDNEYRAGQCGNWVSVVTSVTEWKEVSWEDLQTLRRGLVYMNAKAKERQVYDKTATTYMLIEEVSVTKEDLYAKTVEAYQEAIREIEEQEQRYRAEKEKKRAEKEERKRQNQKLKNEKRKRALYEELKKEYEPTEPPSQEELATAELHPPDTAEDLPPDVLDGGVED